MRDIKFRCWHMGEMDYNMGWIWNEIFEGSIGDGLKAMQDNDYLLMQYTGLKDKNGKEIYEGDILGRSPYKQTHVVKYEIEEQHAEGDEWNFSLSYSTGFHLDKESKEYEVIGNIHENKNLLE